MDTRNIYVFEANHYLVPGRLPGRPARVCMCPEGNVRSHPLVYTRTAVLLLQARALENAALVVASIAHTTSCYYATPTIPPQFRVCVARLTLMRLPPLGRLLFAVIFVDGPILSPCQVARCTRRFE